MDRVIAGFWRVVDFPFKLVAYGLIQLYRYTLSAFMGRNCRHAPDLLGVHPRRDLAARLLAGRLDGPGPDRPLPAGRDAWLRSGAGGGSGRGALVHAVALRALEVAGLPAF